MTLLDCGCGVGSITLDLAERVAPGAVVAWTPMSGSWPSPAAALGLTNVSFEQGNVYALRFDDASFDVVLAHTLLFHLSDQPRALHAFRRVVKPGGIVAVSDDDWTMITFPRMIQCCGNSSIFGPASCSTTAATHFIHVICVT